YIVFLFVWVTVVYVPITHWVWAADGWIAGIGALDFAGGIVVHASAGIAAIVAARMIGSRRQIERGSNHTTFRMCCLALACCGSAGSASTPDQVFLPTMWR
ncbi:MAG: ammonia channel protein, partial [Dehalococcoidia bacterium]|nr:ammonia channel protein [Dehalococcoidia bacterium]